jgi:hypothetical protein
MPRAIIRGRRQWRINETDVSILHQQSREDLHATQSNESPVKHLLHPDRLWAASPTPTERKKAVMKEDGVKDHKQQVVPGVFPGSSMSLVMCSRIDCQ